MGKLLLLYAMLCAAPLVAAADGIEAPERLTAGASDQLLGQLSADGQELYFASTEHATSQIYVQDRRSGAARLLFDDGADASWPRLSPDGARLLYISYHGDAAGDLCVRDLKRSTERTCLEDRDHADLQAIWAPDGKSALLLSRRGLHGDLVLRRVWLDGGAPRAAPFLSQNLSSPALSPDGRWLAYVPVVRSQAGIGVGFASQAAPELLLQRLSDRGPEGAPLRLRFHLPGATGQPAFSGDGQLLYFTQYLNDTNFDGNVDGADHGVLFRVPFIAAAAAPVTTGSLVAPMQLTSAAWNCQYPAPSSGTNKLIATCSIAGSLDIYSMPLDGSVSAEWGEGKLRDELRSSQDRWEGLLLSARLLLMARGPARAPLLLSMIRQHLLLRGYESAAFYARELVPLGGAMGIMGRALEELAAHRREERLLDRGQLSARFVRGQRERLGRLATLGKGAPKETQALLALVESEVLDTIGDKGEALAAFRSVALLEQRQPFVLHLYGECAKDLLGPLSDHSALLAAFRALSAHPALDVADRLTYGGAFVKELVRGQGDGTIRARLLAQRAQVDPASELGFLLELEGWLQQLSKENQEPVREGVFALYRKHEDRDRRRALIAATVGRAAALDSDQLTYQFANTWVSGLSRDAAERRYAERLYRQVVLDRAYVQWSDARVGDARGNFFGVTLQTDSLESHIGFIESRLREGKQDVVAIYEKKFAQKKDDPVYRFVRAYLIARALPEEGAALLLAVATATEELRQASAKLAQRVELQHLWGYLAHRSYLHSGRSESAQEADAHYRLALDLGRDNPRYRAAVLGQLGLLHAAVGNYRAALGYLEERSGLPFVDVQAELRHQLVLARSRFHGDRPKEGAEAAEGALALLGKHKDLGRYRALCLDRAALYHLAAGEAGRAYERYQELGPLLDGDILRNRFVLRLGRAAAALGAGHPREALSDLALAERLVFGPDPRAAEALRIPHEDLGETLSAVRLLLLGLRAQAHRALDETQEADRALATRREELLRRQKRRDLDEDVLELARVEASMAGLRLRRRELPLAMRHIEAGLLRADDYGARTGTPVHEVGLSLLDAYAKLHLLGQVPLSAGALSPRLAASHRALGRMRGPRWADARGRLTAYRALLALGSAGP